MISVSREKNGESKESDNKSGYLAQKKSNRLTREQRGKRVQELCLNVDFGR